jgi:hypothetical protein
MCVERMAENAVDGCEMIKERIENCLRGLIVSKIASPIFGTIQIDSKR